MREELQELAKTPVKGCRVDLVKITSGVHQISKVVSAIQSESRLNTRLPRAIRLISPSMWEAEMSMIKLGGSGCWGSGHLDNLLRCLRRLSDGGRPLCLFLDRAGRMSISDQESIAALVDWIADHFNMDVRLVFLLQKIDVWSVEHRGYVRAHRVSSLLEKQAESVTTLERDGMTEEVADERKARSA